MNYKTKTVKIFLSLMLVASIFSSIMPISATRIVDVAKTSEFDSNDSEKFKVPDIIDEEEQEEKSYVGRVKEDEADLYTFVFKNEDGSNTMRVFDHPVKYIDDKGETRDISLEISKYKDGSFKSTDHMIKASFGNDISEGIGLEYDDVRIEMTAKAESNEKAKAGLSDDGKKLTYAVDDKTSYVYSLTYCGIKEDIVVNEYTGQTEYEFTLNTNGLHPVKIDDSVFLADNDEEIKASIGDIIIFTADNRNNDFGELQFETVEENGEYKFTIVLDPDYLRDEKTAYPITIDPTIEVYYNGAINDITINSNDNEPNGSSGSIYVGLRNTYGISRVLMKFPSFNIKNYVFRTSDIISASVELRDLLCEGTELTINCHKFSGGMWDEATATWFNVNPNNYGDLLDSNTVSYTNGLTQPTAHRYAFDITEAVYTWYVFPNNQQYGIIFKSDTENVYRHKTFASYNRASYKPSFTFKYKQNQFYSNYEYNGNSQFFSSHRNNYVNTLHIYPYYKDDGLQLRSNCYGYSFRMFYQSTTFYNIDPDYVYHDDNTNEDYYAFGYSQQPGEFAVKTNGINIYRQNGTLFDTLYNYEDLFDFYSQIRSNFFINNDDRMYMLRQLLVYDANTLGYTLSEYTGSIIPDAIALNGKRLIAVVISPSDYHFYMQHSDNTWSHKRGMLEPQNTCIDHGVVLTNYNIREHISEGAYTGGSVKFFLISKLPSIDFSHYSGNNATASRTNIYSTDYAGSDMCTAQHLGTIPTSIVYGNIGYVGDIDYYSFYVDSYSLYTIKIECTNANFSYIVSVYDAMGNLKLIRNDSNGTVCPWLFDKGYYIIKISKNDQVVHSSSLRYKINIE